MKISTLGRVLSIAIALLPTMTVAQPDPICPSVMEQQIIDLINNIRADSGRSVLEVDRRLIVASRCHSNDMGLNEFISHVGSDGSTWLERAADAGYTNPSGELLGAGFTSAAAVVAAWMANSIQRANILETTARHIGAGYAQYQNMYEHWYTLMLGRESGAAVPPDCTCCVGRVGDVNGSGEDEPTIGDVSVLIDAKYITGSCDGIIDCLTEADINQSGLASPDCDDITIGDVSSLIDYLFITGSSLGLADCL
jgi:hypothetical protein